MFQDFCSLDIPASIIGIKGDQIIYDKHVYVDHKGLLQCSHCKLTIELLTFI